MKKKGIIFLCMLSICTVSYSASIEENLKSIESKYDSICSTYLTFLEIVLLV